MKALGPQGVRPDHGCIISCWFLICIADRESSHPRRRHAGWWSLTTRDLSKASDHDQSLQAAVTDAPAASEKKLWGGRFTGKTDPLMEKFNESLPFDKRMWAEDIRVGGQLKAFRVAAFAMHGCERTMRIPC